MSDFKPYPAYKDSGVEWIGEVPAHWEMKRLRHIACVNPAPDWRALEKQQVEYSFLPMEAIGETGALDTSRRKPLSELRSGYSYFAEGDIVYAKVTPCFENGKGAVIIGLEGGHGFGTTELTVLRSRTIDRNFLYALTYSGSFRMPGASEMLGAGGLKRVPEDFARNYRAAIPPGPEQSTIASYLDRATSRIDALISKKTHFIQLLREKRHALIAHAVTKGLDAKVPMKDSGVAWLGLIPQHWSVFPSKRLFAVRSEPARPDDRVLTASQKYGVIYQSDFVEIEGRRVAEVILGIENLKHVEPNDFIISMRSFQGGLEWCQLRGSTSFHYVMVTPIKNVWPAFFTHLFKSTPYIHALRRTSDLIRDGQELRYSNFIEVPLPVIPIEEQKEIAMFLDSAISRIENLMARTERSIELLHEHRTALIAAAVTGKIDLRDAA